MKDHPFLVKRLLFVLLLALLASCSHVKPHKFTVADVPDPKKNGGGYVSNPDHLISETAAAALNTKLSALDNAGKVQVAVVLLHSIGENVPKDFAHQLFNYWKIGDREKNNGLLILMVEDARRLEFETGYGIEADMPDITCFRIQQEYMIPHIKEQDNDAALLDGVTAVAALFNTGNYAYDRLPEPLPDNSLMNADSIAPVDVAASDNVVYAQPQQLADTSSYASSYTGSFSFIGIICWIFVSAVMMSIFFGKKIKEKKDTEDVEPVQVSSLPNEFLRPRWIGLILLHAAALGCIFYVTTQRHKDVGFLKTCLIYYLVWVAFMHVAVLIIMLRSKLLLKETDRHEKWLRLELLRRDLQRAVYVFPLPYLWLYVRWLQQHLNHLRNDPYDCQECHQPMEKLGEKADDHYLDKGQLVEESLHSVDYDVWRCEKCNIQTVLNYTNMRSGMADCPSCRYKTYKCTKTVTKKHATTSKAGWGVRKYYCKACGFTHDYMFVIPRKSESSSSSSSSGSSFSSSSSSSSSWGGGSSGGGGAGSSW